MPAALVDGCPSQGADVSTSRSSVTPPAFGTSSTDSRRQRRQPPHRRSTRLVPTAATQPSNPSTSQPSSSSVIGVDLDRLRQLLLNRLHHLPTPAHIGTALPKQAHQL